MAKIFLIFLLSILWGCTHRASLGDRKLKRNEVPDFLRLAAHSLEGPEFYEKILPGKKLYEVKSGKGHEISLTFDEKGNFIEREEDIKFKEIPEPVLSKISSYISTNFSGSKIIETEKKKTQQSSFYDVEIRHDSSPSGYWELSFDEQGTFASKEEENFEQPLTLN